MIVKVFYCPMCKNPTRTLICCFLYTRAMLSLCLCDMLLSVTPKSYGHVETLSLVTSRLGKDKKCLRVNIIYYFCFLNHSVSRFDVIHFILRIIQHYVQQSYLQSTVRNKMSRIVRKPDFCLGENKGADQLRGNREADQRLCFRYTDSTIPLLLKSEISSF